MFSIVNGRQQAEIWSRVNGTYTDEEDIAFPNEMDKWYTIKVVAEGDDFEFYIDDELITKWSDDKLKSGRVGVRTYSSVSHFDHVFISGPGIPSTPGEPGFAVNPAAKLSTIWGSIKSR